MSRIRKRIGIVLWGFILAVLYLGFLASDDSGLGRNYCRADLEKATRISDAIYRMEITASTATTLAGSTYKVCDYSVRIGEPLKTTRWYKLFGNPEITTLTESTQLPSSFNNKNFWESPENPACRPNGNYLFFAKTEQIFSSNRAKHLSEMKTPLKGKSDIGIGDCNLWAVISDSYADRVQNLLKQKQ